MDEYLQYLHEHREIEGDSDSDDKARALVRAVLGNKRGLPSDKRLLVLMIKDMQDGYTGDDDERAILNVLLGAENDPARWAPLPELFAAGKEGLSPAQLFFDLDGAEEEELLAFFGRNFKQGKKVAQSDSRELGAPTAETRDGEADHDVVAGNSLKPLETDDESEGWLRAAEKRKDDRFEGLARDGEAKFRQETVAFANSLVASLIETKKQPKPNGARIDNLRGGLAVLFVILSSDEVKGIDEIPGIAYRSEDEVVRSSAITSLLKDAYGVVGQQRFLRRLAKLVGKEIPATPDGSREWLDAHTEKVGEVFSELDRAGIPGSGSMAGMPRSIEMSNRLLHEYTDHVNDAPFDPAGRLGGARTNAAKQIELDCDGLATYGQRLLRAQGWTTVGYLTVVPNGERDAHAVSLARKGDRFIGVSNTNVQLLGSGEDMKLEDAKRALLVLALDVYGTLTGYKAYYLPAQENGTPDRRQPDPAASNVTPYAAD